MIRFPLPDSFWQKLIRYMCKVLQFPYQCIFSKVLNFPWPLSIVASKIEKYPALHLIRPGCTFGLQFIVCQDPGSMWRSSCSPDWVQRLWTMGTLDVLEDTLHVNQQKGVPEISDNTFHALNTGLWNEVKYGIHFTNDNRTYRIHF